MYGLRKNEMGLWIFRPFHVTYAFYKEGSIILGGPARKGKEKGKGGQVQFDS